MSRRPLAAFPCISMLLVGLILWAGASTPETRAQDTGAITGQVVDRQTQAPLPDINVVVAGTLYGAATDDEGAFRIEGLPPDTYTVQVSALGYRTARLSVTVAVGETAQVTLRLTPTAEEAAASVVDPDTAALQPRATIGRRTLREADVADLGAALRDVPGGGAVRHGALGIEPVVRGLAGAQLGVFVDGARMMAGRPFEAGSALGVLDPTMAERITVVKGPVALMQGGGALGAVRVETSGVSGDGSRSGALHGSFRGNGSAAETAGELQGRAFGASYRVQGVYRAGRDYTTGSGASVPAGYAAGGAHGRVDVPLTEMSTLSVRGAVQDQRAVAYPGRTLDVQSARRGYGTIRYRLDRGAGLIRTLQAQAHAAQSLHDLGNASQRTDVPLPADRDDRLAVSANAEQNTLGGQWSVQFAPLSGWRFTVGADGYRADQRGDWRGGLTGGIDPVLVVVGTGVIQQNIGGFTNGTRALGPVDFSGTARIDWMETDVDQSGSSLGGLPSVTTSTVDWSGALTLSTALTPQWTASAGVGSTVRPPSARERYAERFLTVGAPEQTETRGNPRLSPERSTQVDVWMRGTFERGSLHLNGFARWVDDYITLEPTLTSALYPLSPEPVYRYVNGSAFFYGIDASGRFIVNPLLTLSGRASYAWGEDEAAGAPAPHVAPLMGAASARAEAPFNENLYLDVTARFATTRERVRPIFGERSTGGYAVLDLRLGLALSSDATLVLRAENVTDVQYAYPLNASDPFTGLPIAEPGRTLGMGLRVAF